MASTINAAVGGIVNTADASGELALQASGTTVATLTASGNVGIGTASPGAKLDVAGGGNLLLSGASTGDQLIRVGSGRSGNGYSYIDLQGDTTYSNGLRLIRLNTGANAGSNIESRGTGALSLVTQEAAPIVLSTSATERMRVTSTGNLLVGTTTDLSGVTGAISDVNGNVRAIPQSGAAKTTSYTLVKGDVGEFINVGSGGSIVVPDAVFATGDVVSVFNNTSGNITITCSITTAYIGGTDADKATITLATRGIATILFISGTVCVVNGNVS